VKQLGRFPPSLYYLKLMLYCRLLADDTLLAGYELLPVYPQPRSASGAVSWKDSELKARVRLLSFVDDNASCSFGRLCRFILPRRC